MFANRAISKSIEENKSLQLYAGKVLILQKQNLQKYRQDPSTLFSFEYQIMTCTTGLMSVSL